MSIMDIMMGENTHKETEDMKKLVKKLNMAGKAYYAEDKEIMSNQEYDQEFDRLKNLERNTGIILKNSPTQNVGYEVVSELKKVTHEIPALSLEKTKLIDELVKFLEEKEGVMSWKMDGLTLQVTYEKGNLKQAVTRGNGIVGEDVTHNAPVIDGLPMHIPYLGKLIIRGEVVISYTDFEKINAEVKDREPYKNPRNLAAASLRLTDPVKAKARHMKFKGFEEVQHNGNIPKDVAESFSFLKENNISVVEHLILPSEANMTDVVEKAVEQFKKSLQFYPYPTDGLVVSYKDSAYGHSLGLTKHHPKHSIAFKWKDETVPSILRDIEWSASRTGLLNPVAVFDTVEIEGTNVSRASVHNLSIMEDLNLAIGAEIAVFKANMIIPQIAECDGAGKSIVIPNTCPICGNNATIKETNGTKLLYCENSSCAAKHIGRFVRMVSRNALNVIGLAENQIQCFVEKGWLKQPSDLFHLTEHETAIKKMDGFGEKSFLKMAENLENARKTEFSHFFYALGIPGAGEDVANILNRNAKELSTKTNTDTKTEMLVSLTWSKNLKLLTDLPGIGEVTAKNIENWFRENEEEYKKLLSELEITDNVIASLSENKLDLSGKVFVITGSLNTYENRNALKTEIEKRGGKVSSSVSKNTDYLINNDLTSSSGKNKKAKELNIPIITEEEYKKM